MHIKEAFSIVTVLSTVYIYKKICTDLLFKSQERRWAGMLAQNSTRGCYVFVTCCQYVFVTCC